MQTTSTIHIPRITVTLMLTHQCNLNCVYCYEKNKDSKRVMTIDTMKEIITKAFDSYKDKYDEIVFDFMGGEPILEFENIKKIAEWTWEREWLLPYLFYATTNGTLVKGEIKEWFSANKDRFVLGLSYDGNEYVQNLNRSNSSSHIDLHYFVNTWPFQSIKMTISPESMNKLSNSIIYLHSLGIDKIFANLAYGVKWTDEHLVVYKKELKKITEFYLSNPDIPRASLLDMNLLPIYENDSNQKYCGAGTGMIFCDFDGKQYPCHLLSPVNLDSKRLKKIEGYDYCDGDLFSPIECKKCLLKNVCPSCCGMNYLYLGSFTKRFGFMCKAIKIQIAQNMIFQFNRIKQLGSPTNEDYLILNTINKLKRFKQIQLCLI